MADATATNQDVNDTAPDTGEAPSEQQNDVQVEDLGPTKKRITITIPAESVDEKVDDSLVTLASESTLPGFRKGRAPRKLIERRFGEAVREETRNQLIADAWAEVVEAKKLRPLNEPEPAEEFDLDSLKVEPGQPLTVKLEVEVMPEFDLPELERVDIKKPTMEITDDLIDAELNRQQFRLGQPEEVKENFEPGDRLVGPGTVTREGEDEPFFTHDQVLVVIPEEEDGGRGQVLGLSIDNLREQLADTKVGDTVTFETVGPESHEREDIRGKKLRIEITIRQGQRVIPASTEQLLSLFGMADEDTLREQIRTALERRRDQEVADAMRSQVYWYLDEQLDIPLPEKASQNQIARTIERERMQMLYRGMSEEEVENHLAEIRAESEARAKRRLKMFLIMQRLAEHFEVEVAPPEVNQRVAEMAMQNNERPEALRQRLSESGQLQVVATQIREQKAADRVVAQAEVAEISADEWREIYEQKRQEAAEGISGGTLISQGE